MTTPIWGPVLVILMVFLVPLVPAILIYKLLPDQKILVKGDFAGLQLNATGAFAGYLVLLLAAERLEDTISKDPRFAPQYDTWTITGSLELSDPNDVADDRTVSFAIVPPIQSVVSRGNAASFEVKTPLGALTKYAAIQVNRPPYSPLFVPLASGRVEDPVTHAEYQLTKDNFNRSISIDKTLTLRKQLAPYVPTEVYTPKILP